MGKSRVAALTSNGIKSALGHQAFEPLGRSLLVKSRQRVNRMGNLAVLLPAPGLGSISSELLLRNFANQ
jgi:hypothetical protein